MFSPLGKDDETTGGDIVYSACTSSDEIAKLFSVDEGVHIDGYGHTINVSIARLREDCR